MQQTPPRWRFFRAGGIDQVRIDSASELLAIGDLDQKLWVALSCPVRGIEFDARTLALIDTDANGHVRASELIAAVHWVGERLKDPEVLTQGLDGVPLAAIRDDDTAGQAIAAAARTVLHDAGAPNDTITVEMASAAQAQFAARSHAAWLAAGADAQPLGDASEAAYAALQAVAAKIDDFFVRCHLTAFDARAVDALDAAVPTLQALAASTLVRDHAGIAGLPLAKVEAGASLPLLQGVNPAWAERMAAFCSAVVQPSYGALEALPQAQWEQLKARFAAYAAWRGGEPDPNTTDPGVRDLEQLARYVRDLHALANNFVAFRDFYARKGPATFQVGTLYLDARSCELCVAVNDAGRHASLANLSGMYLVYADCVRGADKLSIAAAFTAGDADQLLPGRNGVFYDRQGRDWNASVTRIVEHPISLRQAFWSPYKRFVRLVSEQLQKMAASKNAESQGKLADLATAAPGKVAAPAAAKPAAAPVAPFDVAKFAGIFAAIGLAIGAIGSMLASVMTGLFALSWWQIPLALLGLMLLISGPAVLLAWFKLRTRNLGPLLDANGWAINSRARISIAFGKALTQTATLPDGAERALTDPYADKEQPWPAYLAVAAAIAVALAWKLGAF